MTAEQQRIRIAMACGAKIVRFCGEREQDHEPVAQPQSIFPEHLQGIDTLYKCKKCDGYRWGRNPIWHESEDADEFPDYCGSLDAIQRAVLSQDADFQDRFDTHVEVMLVERPHFHALSVQDWCDCFCAVLDEREKPHES